MKLKLDLHPIYNDSAKIEAALAQIIDDAVVKRATEVEIIPGKGSGALKKTVLRFLDRPDVKARYHRMEKDGDNWGRLFVHFRPPPVQDTPRAAAKAAETASFACFCCEASVLVPVGDLADGRLTVVTECPACGSPNRVTLRRGPGDAVRARAESGYDNPAS